MNGSSKILILLLLTLCSTLSVIPAAAISNGQDDDTNTFPSVGVVLYQDTDEAWWYVCSGTLIGPNLFLTAAHCTSTLAHYLTIGIINDLSDIYVSFDTPLTLPPTSSPLTFGVTAMHSHPSYNPRTGQPDVGLIILDTADTGITPATLPSEGYLTTLRAAGTLRSPGTPATFTVVGYGGVLTWPPPDIDYTTPARRYTTAGYLQLLKSWLLLSQQQALEYGGSCYGDSGGPIFHDNGGTPILVAITSWGDNQCVATAFNYRVDIPATLEFIETYNS